MLSLPNNEHYIFFACAKSRPSKRALFKSDVNSVQREREKRKTKRKLRLIPKVPISYPYSSYDVYFHDIPPTQFPSRFDVSNDGDGETPSRLLDPRYITSKSRSVSFFLPFSIPRLFVQFVLGRGSRLEHVFVVESWRQLEGERDGSE